MESADQSAPPDEDVLARVRAVAGGAHAALQAEAGRIDELNVFPVPDGDTGTNLLGSVQVVVDALAGQAPADRELLARSVARAALMGARGNSGVILSQIVRGLCESLAGRDGLDATAVAQALRAASDAAYRAVPEPVEGTMLTVVREMAAGAGECEGFGGGLDQVLDAALARGEDALARTPQMLAALRDAGVVDAGGAGLVALMRGALAGLRGEPLRQLAAVVGPARTVDAAHLEYSQFRYCTTFLVLGSDLDMHALEMDIRPLGDCLLVVGDREALKVHVHTDDPGAALSRGTALGVIDRVEIADMHAQVAQRRNGLAVVPDPDAPPDRACDVVCVVAGRGNRALVESFGVRGIVDGGQGMNPATGDLLRAIEACRAREVVLLPNNPNVQLAAERAASEASRPVEVVASRSIQAGLAAIVEYRPGRDAAGNAAAMRETLAGVRAGAIARAARDSVVNGIAVRAGHHLVLLDDHVVATADGAGQALHELIDRLLEGGGQVMTVLIGCDDPGDPALGAAIEAVQARRPDLDVEVHDGGQPHYPALVSVE